MQIYICIIRIGYNRELDVSPDISLAVMGARWELDGSSMGATPIQNSANVSDLIHRCIEPDTQRVYPVTRFLLHFYHYVMWRDTYLNQCYRASKCSTNALQIKPWKFATLCLQRMLLLLIHVSLTHASQNTRLGNWLRRKYDWFPIRPWLWRIFQL